MDPKIGLTGKDLNERTKNFGNNFRADPLAKSWFQLFKEAFKDDMLKLLVVCAIIALTFDLAVATPEERHTCKSTSSHFVLLIEFSNESFSVDQRLRYRYCSTSCSLSWFFRRLEKGNSVYEKPC